MVPKELVTLHPSALVIGIIPSCLNDTNKIIALQVSDVSSISCLFQIPQCHHWH